MITLQNIEVIRVLPSTQGLHVYATYHDWNYEYKFLLQRDGTLKGKTSKGFWEELSSVAASSIWAKLQSYLINGNIGH